MGSVKNTTEELTKLSSSGSGTGAQMLAEAGGREMEEDWSVPLQLWRDGITPSVIIFPIVPLSFYLFISLSDCSIYKYLI